MDKPVAADPQRRRFFALAASLIAAAQLGASGPSQAQTGKTKAARLPDTKPGTHTQFASLKQSDAVC